IFSIASPASWRARVRRPGLAIVFGGKLSIVSRASSAMRAAEEDGRPNEIQNQLSPPQLHLRAVAEGYAIAPKIRRLRLRKKLGLVQLGEHTGLSPAMLSKIE